VCPPNFSEKLLTKYLDRNFDREERKFLGRGCKSNSILGIIALLRRGAIRKGLEMLQRFVSSAEATAAAIVGSLVDPMAAIIALSWLDAVERGESTLDEVAKKFAVSIVSGETETECDCGQVHDSETVEATEMVVRMAAYQLGSDNFELTGDSDAALEAANGFIERVEFQRLALLAEK
jgi:hypothetical protein